jgi:chromosome segregation ATPase
MAEEGTAGTDGQGGAEQGIAGTSFKSPEELAAAYLSETNQRANLEKKLGEQGNELGSLRKQTETLATTLKEAFGKKAEPAAKGPDYTTELSKIEQEIQSLDPMADGYQKTLSTLVSKATKMAAMDQHEKTLNAAGEMMKKELSTRDTQAQTRAFYDANPTFNTPEMQARIKEYIANDRTGMSDPLVAFREIQRDDIAAQAKTLADENAEMKRVLALQQGKDATGKVIVKGQSPGQVTKQPKVTGNELNAQMAAALSAARGA